jgi:hypothetical protein
VGLGRRPAASCAEAPAPFARRPIALASRRTAKNLSHRFARVVEHAVQIGPTTYRALVAQPQLA